MLDHNSKFFFSIILLFWIYIYSKLLFFWILASGFLKIKKLLKIYKMTTTAYMLVLVMIEFTPATLSWCSINTQNSVHEKSSFTSQFIVRDMTRTYSQFGSLIHQRSCFFIVSLRDLLIEIELIRKTFQLISNKIDLFNPFCWNFEKLGENSLSVFSGFRGLV